jgi:hypothetical protein
MLRESKCVYVANCSGGIFVYSLMAILIQGLSMRTALVILMSVIPLETFAQTVFTISPEAVAGLSCWTSTPYSSQVLSTPFFSALASVEGSLRGIIGDSDLAINLGIGYDSRGTGGVGYFYGASYLPISNYVMRLNYIDVAASIRYRYLQAGIVAGLPLNWQMTVDTNSAYNGPAVWRFGSPYMRTTLGIFAAGNFAITEWSSGKLIFVARLDYELQAPITTTSFVFTTENSPIGYLYSTNSIGPIFLARLGLSYEFTVWRGMR